jgi:inorganic pyrophosphatase
VLPTLSPTPHPPFPLPHPPLVTPSDRVFPRRTSAFRELIATRFPWDRWARIVRDRGVTVERPAREPHPEYPHIIYPLDYGFVGGTIGTDGDAVDAFLGTADTGLVGLILTRDYRRGDREAKLLVDCTASEVYTAHGFINYDRTLLDGLLVLRRPMHTLWPDAPDSAESGP